MHAPTLPPPATEQRGIGDGGSMLNLKASREKGGWHDA